MIKTVASRTPTSESKIKGTSGSGQLGYRCFWDLRLPRPGSAVFFGLAIQLKKSMGPANIAKAIRLR
jgi:hypothetical protein